MSYAVINVEDPVGKTVGRRKLMDAWKMGMGMQNLLNEVRRSQGYGALCPKGVFRFRSHEEADAWMVREIVRRAVQART